MSEPEHHFARLYELIPEYVCGTIWLVNMVTLLALNVTPTEARAAIQRLVVIVRPVAIPEFAIGLLLVVSGIVLPYVVGVMLNPLSELLTNKFLMKRYQQQTISLTPAHLKALHESFQRTFSMPYPLLDTGPLLIRYFEHLGSPVAALHRKQRRDIHMRLHLALPVGLLAAVIVYAAGGQTSPFFMAGVVVGAVSTATLVHSTNMLLIRANENVYLTFLMLIAEQERCGSASKP